MNGVGVGVGAAYLKERTGQSLAPEETRIEPATRHHYSPSATRLPLSRVLIRGSIRPTWQSPSDGLTSLPHGAGFASIHWQPATGHTKSAINIAEEHYHPTLRVEDEPSAPACVPCAESGAT